MDIIYGCDSGMNGETPRCGYDSLTAVFKSAFTVNTDDTNCIIPSNGYIQCESNT